jgi:RHS repeat-associated protein
VTTAGTNTYCYDQNGNMVRRNIGLNTYNLAYDVENRLVQVSGAATASFGYDGDGKRVISTEGGATTVYIGNYFEWKGSTSTMVKYYYAGAERVAMRTGEANPLWLLGDHLDSTSVVANYDGTVFINGGRPARQGYKAWGEQRFPDPLNGSPLPTTFRYTGQREASFGLYFYGARWYDDALGRFTSPDTIVPQASQGVQAWDRYCYVNNNPLKNNDPSGHCPMCVAAALGFVIGAGVNYAIQTYNNYQSGMSLSQSMKPSNINLGAVLASGVGGAVAGLTMGALSAGAAAIGITASANSVAAIAGNAVGGAIANVAGGQAEALATGLISSTTIDSSGVTVEGGAQGVISQAEANGFMNGNALTRDAIVGGAVGLGVGIAKFTLADSSTPPYPYHFEDSTAPTAKAAIPNSLVRPISNVIDAIGEYSTQKSQEEPSTP